MRKPNSGVTLMELLVVIAVISILSAIAIPTYRSYVIRANRSDAKAALLSAAGALERCYTRFNSYATADGCTVAFNVSSPSGNYTITAPTQTATAFSLLATAVDGQAKDTDCKNFTLTNSSVRGVTGTKPAASCWGR